MLLVSVLARRYAPLEAENTIKSIAEFLSFRRQPGEGIDTVLVRFDILRNMAQARAGFAVNWTGLSWLLLQTHDGPLCNFPIPVGPSPSQPPCAIPLAPGVIFQGGLTSTHVQ